jgi:hypothetical protein
MTISLICITTNIDGQTPNKANTESGCNPTFKIEGMNDAKGGYAAGNESWTIHFGEEEFIAFHTYDGRQGDPATLVEIVALSNCEFGIMLDTDEGENASSMTLIFNETEKYYDLHISSYDPETDSWYVKVFKGNSDNG